MDKQTGVWIMFFHEAPGVPNRRTFAAVVFPHEAAYLACSTLSAKDQYNRRKGNDIALHRAVRYFEVMHTGLLTTSQEDRFLNSAGKYEAHWIAAVLENSSLSNKRAAARVIHENLVMRHGFRPAPLKGPALTLRELEEAQKTIQQRTQHSLAQKLPGKSEEAPGTL